MNDNSVLVIHDDQLLNIFKNQIERTGLKGSNSELFIVDSEVFKIYMDSNSSVDYGINMVKRILNFKSFFKDIPSIVLPEKLLVYNNKYVGFSMQYIDGKTLDYFISNECINDAEAKTIFKKILDIIDGLKTADLPFTMYFGDLHEKNIIIDKNRDLHIIDCDSFIFNNNKMVNDSGILMGMYLNHHYDSEQLKNVKHSGDMFCLLCMILNYVYHDIIDSSSQSNPIKYIEEHVYSTYLNSLIDRTSDIENFTLSSSDIDNIFRFKDKYKIINNDDELYQIEINKLIKKIRNIEK